MASSPETWKRVNELFHAALERPADGRTAFVQAVCGGDEDLQREVLSLLEFYDGDDEGTGQLPALGALGDARRIGSYLVIGKVGEGGMSEVYLAVRADAQFEQRVCLKLIKPGMDSDFIVRRFLSERQILASLEHPNIARLLDGGSTDRGLPYFVMEYVEGLPIDAYCEQQALNVRERLQLFQKVCAAVQYAHRNLVVHRDLKPGNILVDGKGEPKLLDFGIARLLDPTRSPIHLDTTVQGVRLLTLAYASPEQVNPLPSAGRKLSTATDVYSLGVVLYELLTGRRPYDTDGKSTQQLTDAILTQEPAKPSETVGGTGPSRSDTDWPLPPEAASRTRGGNLQTLRRDLRGDLDCIVLKALRKEPEQRYSSVEQFGEDIRRHLEGLPVEAYKGDFRYRVGKFVTRHRAGVAAGTLVALALVAGFAGTAWQAGIAQRRFDQVRGLANALIYKFDDAIKDLNGTTPARKLLVGEALGYLRGLQKEAAGDVALQSELAGAYQRVGDVQGKPNYPNLGDMAGALESHTQALALRTQVAGSQPGSATAKLKLAESHLDVGELQAVFKGDLAAAEGHYRKAIALARSLAEGDSSNFDARRRWALGLQKLANLQGNPYTANLKRPQEALATYRQAGQLFADLSRSQPNSFQALMDLNIYTGLVSDTLMGMGRPKEALAQSREALGYSKQAHLSQPLNAMALRQYALDYSKIGLIRRELGNPAAVEDLRQAVVLNEQLVKLDPNNVNARRDLLVAYGQLGRAFEDSGDLEQALAYHRKALGLSEQLARLEPDNAQLQIDLAVSYAVLGRAHRKRSLLAKTDNPAAERAEACRWFGRGQAVFAGLQKRGRLSAGDTELVKKLAALGADCPRQ
ncbi:MAG: protein kinase [Aphanocapsa lilacina HA4352-LM1]|nr:protein kinase [Aphanocapsa lilacina HA4352-LM1]